MAGFLFRLLKMRSAAGARETLEAIDPYALIPARLYALRQSLSGRAPRLIYFSMEYFSALPSLRAKPVKRRDLERPGTLGGAPGRRRGHGMRQHRGALREDFGIPMITVRNVPYRSPAARPGPARENPRPCRPAAACPRKRRSHLPGHAPGRARPGDGRATRCRPSPASISPSSAADPCGKACGRSPRRRLRGTRASAGRGGFPGVGRFHARRLRGPGAVPGPIGQLPVFPARKGFRIHPGRGSRDRHRVAGNPQGGGRVRSGDLPGGLRSGTAAGALPPPAGGTGPAGGIPAQPPAAQADLCWEAEEAATWGCIA